MEKAPTHRSAGVLVLKHSNQLLSIAQLQNLISSMEQSWLPCMACRKQGIAALREASHILVAISPLSPSESCPVIAYSQRPFSPWSPSWVLHNGQCSWLCDCLTNILQANHVLSVMQIFLKQSHTPNFIPFLSVAKVSRQSVALNWSQPHAGDVDDWTEF